MSFLEKKEAWKEWLESTGTAYHGTPVRENQQSIWGEQH